MAGVSRDAQRAGGAESRGDEEETEGDFVRLPSASARDFVPQTYPVFSTRVQLPIIQCDLGESMGQTLRHLLPAGTELISVYPLYIDAETRVYDKSAPREIPLALLMGSR